MTVQPNTSIIWPIAMIKSLNKLSFTLAASYTAQLEAYIEDKRPDFPKNLLGEDINEFTDHRSQEWRNSPIQKAVRLDLLDVIASTTSQAAGVVAELQQRIDDGDTLSAKEQAQLTFARTLAEFEHKHDITLSQDEWHAKLHSLLFRDVAALKSIANEQLLDEMEALKQRSRQHVSTAIGEGRGRP